MNSKIPDAKLMLQDDKEYGLTLNPSEQCFQSKNDEQFACAYAVFLQRLNYLKPYMKEIELYPEYAPGKIMNKKMTRPRLHFHGKVIFNSFRMYTKGFEIVLNHNTYKINDKVDLHYCKKNRNPMENWCKEYGFPYKITWKNLSKCDKKVEDWYKRANMDNMHETIKKDLLLAFKKGQQIEIDTDSE